MSVATNAGSAPVALTLRQVGPTGSRTLHKAAVPLMPGRQAVFSLGLYRIG